MNCIYFGYVRLRIAVGMGLGEGCFYWLKFYSFFDVRKISLIDNLFFEFLVFEFNLWYIGNIKVFYDKICIEFWLF